MVHNDDNVIYTGSIILICRWHDTCDTYVKFVLPHATKVAVDPSVEENTSL